MSVSARSRPALALAAGFAIVVAAAVLWWAWPAGVPRRYLAACLVAAAAIAVMLVGGRGGMARLRAATIGRLPSWWRVTLVCGAIAAVGLRLARWPDVQGVPFLVYTGAACTAIAAWCGATVAVVRRATPKRASLTAGAAAVVVGFLVVVAIAAEAVLALGAAAADRHGASEGAAAGASADTSGGADGDAIAAGAPGSALLARFESLRGDDPIDRDTFERAVRRHDHRVMPDAWRSRRFHEPGARLAQWWHGVRHVEGPDGVRIPNDPDSAPTDGPVILVIGDSFTYGLGIETRDRFTEKLEGLLRSAGIPVRVVNRGVCSDQSEDVLRRLPGDLNLFTPVVAVYAICLNDFLPSGVDIYDHSWRLPEWLAERSRLLRAIDRSLVQAQLAFGLSADFHLDILRNLGSLRDRFARDVVAMQALARERDVPLLAIVLDPIPSPDGSGAAVTAAAEEACRAAGIEVVDTAPLRQRFGDVPLMVSPWEPHANEIAHAAWARLLFDRIRPMIESPPAPPSATSP